ncbi:sensor histidine kinase [Halalkalibacter sp. AB-rgal2]|uniref:sensor histidine kinase n=1 Tax=Halalkalibacter sp. AB-rgal2 TaxID=3242695 RepID=UPI00359ED8DA
MKRILSNYLKDRALFMTFYLMSFICVIGFFYLSDPIRNEILYPVYIGFFFLVVFLLVDGTNYYQFNKRVQLLLMDEYAELQPKSKEQAQMKQLLDRRNRQTNAEHSQLVEQHKEGMAFLSHWIHHLKTPVSVMELILDRQLENEEDMKRLKQENKMLHTRIEQGLTMIRMERFENDFEIRAVHLITSLREVINERKSDFIYNSVYPLIECEQEELLVLTDKKWNNIMLDQVISNAIKYSSGQGKKMIVRVEREHQRVIVSITDHGIGIPPYDMERIFDPFFTGENGREFRHSSGIGLYLCKKIAEKLDHALSVHSELNKGTTVSITYLTKS